MSYFVFKIHAQGRLEYLNKYQDYRPARVAVREARKSTPEGETYSVRLVHGNDQAHAERLLSEKHEPRPLGEDS